MRHEHFERELTLTDRLHFTMRRLGHMLHFGLDSHRNRNRILFIAEERGGISQKELTEAIGIAPASMSTALQKLEEEGCLRREASDEDKRTFTVTITEEGKARIQQLKEERRKEVESLYDCLTDEEKTTLLELLRKLEVSWRERLPEDAFRHRRKCGPHRHEEKSE